MGKKLNGKNALKLIVVMVCLIGFLWQTLEFYFLYLTFPTVVDIQVSVPSEIEIPGITLCSSAGMKPYAVCQLWPTCAGGYGLQLVNFCDAFPLVCSEGRLPEGFIAVRYKLFAESIDLNTSSLDLLRVPLKHFFKCTITGGSEDRECDLDNVVIGSYYSDTNIPNFCFTLNSKWGDPNREIQRMKKSERIQMEIYVDISDRNRTADLEVVQLPKYSHPGSAAVQIGFHSQKMSQSPFVFGQGFEAGKKYQIKVTKDEKHLLPPPYQTNCTDYVKDWVKKDGISPLNQVMSLQECRMNAALQELGCIPYSVDYPHNYTVCKYCENCANETKIGSSCTDLLQSKNQPCDSESYVMNIEEKWVYIIKSLKTKLLATTEGFYIRQKGFNCTFQRVYTRQDHRARLNLIITVPLPKRSIKPTLLCQIINIEVNFDEYEVTNVTYNPKFETLELFSVIGGYMGMYLGISLVAMYEYLETAVIVAYRHVTKSIKLKIKKYRWISHAVKKDRWAYKKKPRMFTGEKFTREIY